MGSDLAGSHLGVVEDFFLGGGEAQALAVAGGNLSRAAEFLGVTRPTLYDLLEKHHIDAAQFGRPGAAARPAGKSE